MLLCLVDNLYSSLSSHSVKAVPRASPSHLALFEDLEDARVESRGQVRVVDAARGHVLQHLLVLRHLVALEPVDGHLPVVDGNEVDQSAVLLNVNVGGFNTGLKVEDVLLLARL